MELHLFCSHLIPTEILDCLFKRGTTFYIVDSCSILLPMLLVLFNSVILQFSLTNTSTMFRSIFSSHDLVTFQLIVCRPQQDHEIFLKDQRKITKSYQWA